MKKFLYVRFILMTTSLFISAAISAQLSANDLASIGKPSEGVIYNANSDAMTLASVKATSGKMFNHFTKNYKNATDLSLRTFDGVSRINYKLNGVSTSSQYDAKGKWQFTISHYDESQLDDATRESVESAYPGFLVYGTVLDVQVNDKSAKLVLIENRREWKRIRINDEGMSIYEEYKKK